MKKHLFSCSCRHYKSIADNSNIGGFPLAKKENDKYDLNEKNDSKELRKLYNAAKNKYADCNFKKLDMIYDIALKEKLFPSIKMSGTSQRENYDQQYLEKWVKKYYNANKNLPSAHKAKPKSSCSDPAVEEIVKYACNLDPNNVKAQLLIHNLFMSAENIQGKLLEEFIAENIESYGWVWCKGSVLRAVDFCTTNGAVLLQVKNKNNTENSSSSNIRQGTPIEKWYRLTTKTGKGETGRDKTIKGEKKPETKWSDFNAIINRHKNNKEMPDCNLGEESYEKFLKKTVKANNKIISEK